MRHDSRQPPGNGTIHVLHDGEIGGEQDIKVALLHQRGADGNRLSFIAGLHDGSVDAAGGLRQRVEIRGDEAMGGELGGEDVEELHEAGGYVFGFGEVGCKGEGVAEFTQDLAAAAGTEGVGERGPILTCGVADAEIAGCDWVQGARVELVKISLVVDEDGTLHDLLGRGIVADDIMGEVVKDFHCEEEARGRDVEGPVEDGFVDNFDLVGVTAGGGVGAEAGGL